MPGDLPAIFIENKTGVIQFVAATLGNGACNQRQMIFFGGPGKGGAEHTVSRLRKNGECGIGIGAAEHFRQDRHTGAGCSGPGDIFQGYLQIFLLILSGWHLDQRKFHRWNAPSVGAFGCPNDAAHPFYLSYRNGIKIARSALHFSACFIFDNVAG